jgi:ParB family chromosome partitioning protein
VEVPIREGLPAHYRMRADAHYVDQLDALPASSIQDVSLDAIEALDDAAPGPALLESIATHGVLEPLLVQQRDSRYRLVAGRRRLAAARALGLRDVPCVVRRLSDAEWRSLTTLARASSDSETAVTRLEPSFDEGDCARSLSAVLSCVELLSGGVPALTRSVAADMIRAETQRAMCALRTAGYLSRGVPAATTRVAVRRVVAEVVDAVAPEIRLRGSRLTTRVETSDEASVVVDEQCLVSVVTAVVLWLSAGLGDVRGAGLEVRVSSHDNERVTFTIAHESVILPSELLAPATRGPVVDSAVAPLMAVRQLAESCGGTCEVSRLARGTQISITLPQ